MIELWMILVRKPWCACLHCKDDYSEIASGNHNYVCNSFTQDWKEPDGYQVKHRVIFVFVKAMNKEQHACKPQEIR